jgi:phospholipid/cholesterol/gamma-HCH transport system ATP-binding protein
MRLRVPGRRRAPRVVPAGTGPVAVVDDVRKRFEDKEVLRGVSFDVRRGETLVIMGGSGSGKTVTLRLLAGLIRPSSGTIRVFDHRIDDLSEEELLPIRRRMGYVFQGAALFDSLSVLENVAYPLREHTGLPESAIRERVAHFLSLVGLGPDVLGLLPAELSGGMRKRVGIARALASEPQMLLFDEPTAGLDPTNARMVGELIVQLRSGVCDTAVVVTHDLELTRTVADRVAILIEGRFAALGTLEAVESSEDPAVQAFLAGEARVSP